MNRRRLVYIFLLILWIYSGLLAEDRASVMPPASPATPAAQKKETPADNKQKKARWQRKKKEEDKDQITSMADLPKNTEQEQALEKLLATVPQEGFAEAKKEPLTQFSDKNNQSGLIYLQEFLEPWRNVDPKETVEMHFDNQEVTELLKFLEKNLGITFLLDDDIQPNREGLGLQPLAGTKISFESHNPLTLKEAWQLSLSFLEMAGFSVVPGPLPNTYRVTAQASKDKPSANRQPLPTFIGVDPELLPDSDLKIRYVLFVENADLTTIEQIIKSMQSASAGPLIAFPELRAIIMTDKAANIRSLISVIQEIDNVTMPETLSIIRLKHTDATKVADLFYKLIGKDPQSASAYNPFSRQKKQTTTQYFTEATRVYAEPRTNSLIVLGTKDNIKRFEDFVLQYVDKTLDIPFSPLHIHQLKYIDATSIATILNNVINKFSVDPTHLNASTVGGVRDGNKFFRPSVNIIPEASGNRLIINSDYEEYLKIREIIEKLDIEQPQVAIKVLILNVDLTNNEQLGTQLRNKVDCCNGSGGVDSLIGNNINFQYTGLGPVITQNTNSAGQTLNGAQRLLGNLIQLANTSSSGTSLFPTGSTLVTLGQDIFGFWGLLAALESYTRVSVVANPFLVTTHKYKAEIKIGEKRRTLTAIVQSNQQSQAFGDLEANLDVIITPQISYDEMVKLNIYVELGQFTTSTDPLLENRLIKKISTEALVANREVIALGGLIQDSISETETGIPLLSSIPLIGWLFKSKTKTIERTSLLILISPEIIKPSEPEVARLFTNQKIVDAKDTLFNMQNESHRRDPIHRWFFEDQKSKEAGTIDKFVSIQQRYVDESQRKHTADEDVLDVPDKQAAREKRSILRFIDTDQPKEVVT